MGILDNIKNALNKRREEKEAEEFKIELGVKLESIYESHGGRKFKSNEGVSNNI